MLVWSLGQVSDHKEGESVAAANGVLVPDDLLASSAKLLELRNSMARLTKDLQLDKIPPHELVKVIALVCDISSLLM